MKFLLPWLAGFLLCCARWRWERFPAPGDNPFLDLVRFHDPVLFHLIAGWYYLAPFFAAGIGGAVLLSAWQVWFSSSSSTRGRGRGSLPRWPLSGADSSLSLVVGETHHPTEPVESERPGWFVLGEKGLFTGTFVCGAVGTGKTSACMHPFARQLLSWQASSPERKAAALVLEVKGDFCHSVRGILDEAGRPEDYLEIGLGGRWQWNPLDAPWMDSYSLAYTVASLMNQLFGRGKEPFWQQASTNLVRNIIELHRITPGWVTLRDVYQSAIDLDRLDKRIAEARREGEPDGPDVERILVSAEQVRRHKKELHKWEWKHHDGRQVSTESDAALYDELSRLGIDSRTVKPLPRAMRMQHLEAVERWHRHDWKRLDKKLQSSIVEGISVFLGLFDQPEVASIFCPENPHKRSVEPAPVDPFATLSNNGKPPDSRPGGVSTLKPLPPLDSLIENGRVLCLNMPSASNPALSRAVGVMLKQAWLGALLLRPARMRDQPDRHFRPAVFLCDEYQAFATVGESDPSGDEKAFSLSRQSRCIPIVATQSISSLRSVTGSGEAWRTLLQSLRTKVFLSLSDDASARLASEMCGQVERLKASYSYNESTPRAGVSLFSGAPGGGKSSLGTSKSYAPRREPLFHPKAFAELDTAQAIVLPFDGRRNLPARRVYLKPHFLPRELSYFRQKERKLL